MSFNLKDPISTPEAYERWLKVLIVLSIGFGIATVVSIYMMITATGDYAVTVLLALTTAIFFFAYREKSNAPRPGSPEYMAIKRQEQAKIDAAKERRYRKSHPHQVARELVKTNKVAGRVSSLDEKKEN